MPKVRMLLLATMLTLPGCALFAGGKPIVTAQSVGCSDLVEPWLKPVEGAQLPEGQTIADWIVFGDAQTAALDKANDRIISGLETIQRCEERDREAIKRATSRRIF